MIKSSSCLIHIEQILWRVQLEIKEDKDKLLFSIKSEMTPTSNTSHWADSSQYNQGSSKLIITSACGLTRSNEDLVFEENNHEEADTLLIYQAVLASQQNPHDAQLVFFSPDTDVLVLVTANYDLMLKNTSISMASGLVQIEPLWLALGKERAKALASLSCIYWGWQYRKVLPHRQGNLAAGLPQSRWIYCQSSADAFGWSRCDQRNAVSPGILCMCSLLTQGDQHQGNLSTAMASLLQTYGRKWQAPSNTSPTALKQHMLRVHVQTTVWAQAALQDPQLDPLQNGYYQHSDGMLKPVTTDVLPAILELVQCKCKSDCSSGRCSCRAKDLACTDMCQCSSQCPNDDDSQAVMYESNDDD